MRNLALHWQILAAMVVGAVLGLTLNAGFATHEYQSQGELLQSGFAMSSSDSADRVVIRLTDVASGEEHSFLVDASLDQQEQAKRQAEGEIVFRSLDELHDKGGMAAAAHDLFYRRGRSTARWMGDLAQAAGDLFLRLLKMVSIPLILASLLSGVLSLGKVERLGRMFGRTLLYYVCTSMLAIVVGLALVNLIRPGVQRSQPESQDGTTSPTTNIASDGLGNVLYEQLQNLIPANPFAAVAEGNFLSIISFTLAFGIFAILAGDATMTRVRASAEAGFAVMMTMTMTIIRLAPAAVLCFILYATATQGIAVFRTLGWYMLTVFVALVAHATITMPLILRFIAKRNPWVFAEAMSPALLTAFSSASSNGTLPLTLTSVETRAGIPNRVSSFVLPLGATVNMDGTALYEVVAVLFIAQWSGVELTLVQQIIVAFTALLASIGAAGIPHAGLVMMVIILQAVGLPTESQGLIIAVDRLLDMCRTSVNVWSDSCGCAVIAAYDSDDD